MITSDAMDRDANYQIITSNEAFSIESTWTFAELTTGKADTHTLFTVAGNCLVTVFGICDTNIAGAGATMEVGVAGNTAALIAQTTGTDIDDGDIWVSASPAVGVQALPAMQILNDGTDIILTIGTAAVTAGKIDFYCLYRPLSDGASITATTPA